MMARSIPEDSGAIRSRVVKQTGPRTGRGKAASSRNARKHGLRSKDVLIPGESPEEFEYLLQELAGDLRPVGAVEEGLVELITSSMWRLRRARRIETSIYMFRYSQLYPDGEGSQEAHVTEEKALGFEYVGAAGNIETLLRYETTIQRSMFRALGRLKDMQSARVTDLEPIEVLQK